MSPIRLRAVVLLLTLTLAADGRALHAQVDTGSDEEMLARTTPRASPVTAAAAAHRCLEVDRYPSAMWPPRTETCRVTEWVALKRVDGSRFFYARYQGESVSRDRAKPDTSREGETVLFAQQADGRLKPVWHAAYNTDIYVSATPTVEAAPGGGALVSIETCYNGTGGCRQTLLLRRAGAWALVRQRWIDQLPRWMNDRFWKGTHVNPATLRAAANLYEPTDANCCPSHDLYARTALVGTSLVLRSYRVGPPSNR